jgi:FdhD protein
VAATFSSPSRDVASVRTLAVRGSDVSARPDRLAGEEPMEIRAAGPGQDPVSVAVTMRTPGHDEELAAGFLLTEGLITGRDVVGVELGHPGEVGRPENVVTVRIARPLDPAGIASRNFVATASCGICGKASLDAVQARCDRLPAGPAVSRATMLGLPAALRSAQRVFDATGGLHAAGLFEPAGPPLAIREDVGRHNAVDKLVGAMLLAGRLPLHACVLLVSGRVSFEIVQKAAMAGIPVTCAISAPSDLAVETAEYLGMTLVGFLRGDGFNVYTHPERIELEV